MRAGQRSYIPGVGRIIVASVEEVQLDDLTEDDAIADGFSSLEELKRELAEIYPAHYSQGRRLFRICFELLPKNETTPLGGVPAEAAVANGERELAHPNQPGFFEGSKLPPQPGQP